MDPFGVDEVVVEVKIGIPPIGDVAALAPRSVGGRMSTASSSLVLYTCAELALQKPRWEAHGSRGTAFCPRGAIPAAATHEDRKRRHSLGMSRLKSNRSIARGRKIAM